MSILTNREKQIFELLINNHTTKEIASILRITDKTVRNHISNVILRLDVNGRTQAIIKLIQMKEQKIYDSPQVVCNICKNRCRIR